VKLFSSLAARGRPANHDQFSGRLRRRLRLGRPAITAVSLLAACGVLAACGTSSGGGSGNGVTLSWFYWAGSPGESMLWQTDANAVTAKYPNIHLSQVSTSYNGYWTKLATEESSNSLQCIAWVHWAQVGQFHQIYLPLNSLIRQNHFDIGGYESQMVDALSWNGQMLGIPFDHGPYMTVYNAKVFEQLGLPLPGEGWTLSQFLHDAAVLKQHGYYSYLPVDPTAYAYDLSGTPYGYLDNGKFDITSSAAFDNAIAEQLSWVAKDGYGPVPTTNPNFVIDEESTGKMAMWFDGPWNLIDYQESVPFKTSWAPLPAGPKGSLTYDTGSGFGITRNCPDPEAAFEAITVLDGQAAEQRYGAEGRGFPALVSEQSSWGQAAGQSSMQQLLYQEKHTVFETETSNYTAYYDALERFDPLGFGGQLTASQFLQQVATASGPGQGLPIGKLGARAPAARRRPTISSRR
jgi:multiple sugar transport system substrate-binding protein